MLHKLHFLGINNDLRDRVGGTASLKKHDCLLTMWKFTIKSSLFRFIFSPRDGSLKLISRL